MAISYDDKNFQRLYREMDVKKRLKTLRGIFRREAAKMKKTAVNNLRSSGIKTDTGLEKGMRTILITRGNAGYGVLISTGKKNKLGMHKNRRGLEKPVLMWAEIGTEKRRTKTKTKIFTRSRKGHNTGRMKRYGFMRKTKSQTLDSATNNLYNEVIKTFKRIAKKNGCE